MPVIRGQCGSDGAVGHGGKKKKKLIWICVWQFLSQKSHAIRQTLIGPEFIGQPHRTKVATISVCTESLVYSIRRLSGHRAINHDTY